MVVQSRWTIRRGHRLHHFSSASVSTRLLHRLGVTVTTLAALASLAGCGASEGSFQLVPGVPPSDSSIQDAQRYCNPEHPEFARADVLATVVLHQATDPTRKDAVGGKRIAVATLALQFCGGTAARGYMAMVAQAGLPKDTGFRILAGTQNPGPGAQGFGLLFVPAQTGSTAYVVSTDGNPQPGVPRGAGLRELDLVALGHGNQGTLDDDSHVSVTNPKLDGTLGQHPVREGPLTVEQMRDLATSTAAQKAKQLGIGR